MGSADLRLPDGLRAPRVYATCRDAAHTFRVIVPREAVGERCEIMHEVNLLDIEIDLGDVLPAQEVVTYLAALS